MRLDAWLSNQGIGSRSEVRRLIRRGKVTVDEAVFKDQAAAVNDDQTIAVDGKRVALRITEAHLLLHKPAGLSCSHDEREAPLIESLYPKSLQHLPLEPAGRLDRDTTGLLIVTSDGQLLHRLIHPKRKVPKRYRITFTGSIAKDAVERCAAGMQLPDEERPCLPAQLFVEGPGKATMILHEGRYHQVKRMMAAIGGAVTALHRDRIGMLDLPADLPPGGLRALLPDELAALQQAGPEE
jgi:16S rRNA pseudouridine516 synthase